MQKRGIMAVCAAIAIQLTLGISYIWSVFQTGIAESIFNGDNAAAALTFSIITAGLGVGSIIGGKLTGTYSTRQVVFMGGLILSSGFFLASHVTAEFSRLLWLTYGVMGGIGMGFTYSTTIACAQKWYPHKKGFVTGITVASCGLGALFFAPIAERCIVFFGGTGVGEVLTFRVLSAVFLVVCSIGSLFLKNPPAGWMLDRVASTASSAKSYTPKEMLKTPQFYLVSFTFMLACIGGLMMIGFAKPIAVAKGLESTATIGVMAIAVFNSIGRVVCGLVSDKLGRIPTIGILLAGAATFALLVNAANGYWIYLIIGVIGFFYGGFLSTFPALTADLFGPKHMATNYGIVMFGVGGAAIISSQVAGYYRDIAKAADDITLMSPAFVIASCCAAAGIVMMLILKCSPKAQEAQPAQNTCK